MNIEIGNVKGFQDYLPPESLKREAVREAIRKWFKLYGFSPVETPIVEYDELMKSETLTGDDEAVSDRFRLKDRAGRNLGLRYEFTFQLAKIIKLNPNLKLPFRRYQIGEVFRDEPISSRRFRQFVQCDADIVGESDIDADSECLALVSDILKELKIDFTIEVNSRKLLSSIIESVQIEDKIGVMREIDKKDKLGEDVVKTNLKRYASSNQILTLFKLMEKPLEFFVENAFAGADEIETLAKKCLSYGIKINFNPSMIRGFAYYTGSIFEIKTSEFKETIAAGGRYDKLVGKYINRDIPAVGISFGLERISELAQINIDSTKAVIISIGKDKDSIRLAKTLRKSGISCEIVSNKIGRAMEYANAVQVPYVIFVGEEEISKKKFKLKNMKVGDEKMLSEKSLIQTLL